MSQYSLLPENASRLERAFERAFQGALDDIESPFPELLDPQRTPPEMLPYLAQDRGVGEWDGDAPTELLRRTVANVWPIRRLAGTRRALVLAVDELDYAAEVVTWYDADAEITTPYHVDVIVEAFGTVDEAVQQRIMRRLANAQSERDDLKLKIVRRVAGTQYRALTEQAGVKIDIRPPLITDREQHHARSTALTTHYSHALTVLPPVIESVYSNHKTYMGSVFSARTYIAVYPRA